MCRDTTRRVSVILSTIPFITGGRHWQRSPLWIALALVLSLNAVNTIHAAEGESPNIVIVMIDDMGYGDLSCLGSPFIKTPNLDRLHASSVRLTNFHVAPMCSPTRGQLLTGLNAMRNGSTIVASSRMMVHADIPMLPQYFADAGYATAIFGKWHVGENYPHRPQDRGFQECLSFPLQEIGSIADYWCNDYFDPVLNHNGSNQRTTGYCTDIFFDHAMKWIQEQQKDKRPFLCYVPLNALHGPQWAPAALRTRIAAQFPKLSAGQIGYLAMLANADENFGRLEKLLEDSKLIENTIVIFLSDNGGYALVDQFNAGMRGGKSRLTEGGHRVPCFIRWPKEGIGGSSNGRDLNGLTQVQDLLPTLLDLCGISHAPKFSLDGVTLAKPLQGKGVVPDRTLIVQYGPPQPFRMACVMQGPWRLLSDIKGTAKGMPELYNLSDDPKQQRNLIESHPEKAAELRAFYDTWWSSVEPETRQRTRIGIGHPSQSSVVLSSAEWREGAMTSIPKLREGIKRHGIWDIEVLKDGEYEFSLRRWPEESGLRLQEGAPAWHPRDMQTPDHVGYSAGKSLPIEQAHLRVGEQHYDIGVAVTDSEATFQIPLAAGTTEIDAYFTDRNRKPLCPAFFVTVTNSKR